MANATYTTKSISTSSQSAARLTFGTAAAALLMLTALHILRPDLDPSWHMVSEYAIGPFGWVQTLVFLTLAISCLLLLVAIRTQIVTRAGKIGLVFLIAAAVGFFMGGMFNAEHPLHALAFLIGSPGISIAAGLISVSVTRNPAWASVRRLVIWIGLLPWISFVLTGGTLFATLPPSGEFGPGVLVGWPNRLFWLACVGWLMVMAWQALKAGGQETP